MRLLTWVGGKVHVLSTLWRELPAVLALKPLFWTTPSRATFPLLMALLYGIPTLVLY